jgi:hypothetical protein
MTNARQEKNRDTVEFDNFPSLPNSPADEANKELSTRSL